MSTALSSASHLKPEIRLAQAVSQFEADLSDEEKKTFKSQRAALIRAPPGVKDVVSLTSEIDRSPGMVGGRRCFGPRMMGFLHAVQQFASLGDVVIGGSQNLIACGVWSLVRMSILSIVTYSSFLEKLSDLIMNVGRTSPRHEKLSLLYPSSKRLQACLSEYFTVVVRLCHQVFKFSKKSALKQFGASLKDVEFQKYQSELGTWARQISSELELLVAQRVDDVAEDTGVLRALWNRESDAARLRRQRKTKLRVLKSLSTYPYETTWKQLLNQGTTTLLNGFDQYRTWKDSVGSCSLVIAGKLGAGKSVLLANLVADLHVLNKASNATVAFFFCRHDIVKGLKARVIFGTLAWQLLNQMQDLSALTEKLDGLGDDLSMDDISDLICHALAPGHSICLIVDGIDECPSEEWLLLAEQISKLQRIHRLRFCISFRLDPRAHQISNLDLLQDLRTIMLPDDNPDIQSYIEYQLEQRLESGVLRLGDPALVLEIQDALTHGSQGMFLWVSLQFDSLCSMETDEDIRLALQKLPAGLPETFARILRKSGGMKRSQQTRILQFILAARRPLTTVELREALGIVSGDHEFRPARLPNDIIATLSCCGGLIIVDEEELTVRVVHHSVKQFLLDKSGGIDEMAFTVDSVNIEMTEAILTYLSYGVFDRQVSTNVVPRMQIPPSRIIDTTFENQSYVKTLALMLMRTGRTPNLDISETLASLRSQQSPKAEQRFYFLRYAKDFVVQHVTAIHIMSISDSTRQLLESNLRARTILKETGTGFEEMLIWAAQIAEDVMFTSIVNNASVMSDGNLVNPANLLAWAARGSHPQVLSCLLLLFHENYCRHMNELAQLLLDASLRADRVVMSMLIHFSNPATLPLRSLFQSAQERQCNLLMKALLEVGAGRRVASQTRVDIYHVAHLLAAEGENDMIMDHLFGSPDTDVEIRDSRGLTALARAICSRDEPIMRLLLGTGRANVAIPDLDGRTPLSHAVRMGFELAVKLLLAIPGIDVNAKERDGPTPLYWAITREYPPENQPREIYSRIADMLLEAPGIDLSEYSEALFLYSCRTNKIKTVKDVLDSGKVDINCRDKTGSTALHIATEKGNIDVIRLLMNFRKLDINRYNKDTETALHLAYEMDQPSTVRLLLSSNILNVNIGNKRGQTALHVAIANGHIDSVRALLGSPGIDVNCYDSQQATPLHVATTHGSVTIVRVLTNTAGIDVNKLDGEQRTPLHIAAMNGNFEIVSVLSRAPGVDLALGNDQGHHARFLAGMRGYTKIADFIQGAQLLPPPKSR